MMRKRKNIRLKEYDYSAPGAYFVTVCTKDRECLFGDVVDGQMRLHEWGKIVERVWQDLPHHYPNIMLDEFVIMPNHFHRIIILSDCVYDVGAGFKPAPTVKHYALPEIARGFKTFSARGINELRHVRGISIWQRNYYEHIIQNEKELNKTRQYILNNPANWSEDPENVKTNTPLISHA